MQRNIQPALERRGFVVDCSSVLVVTVKKGDGLLLFAVVVFKGYIMSCYYSFKCVYFAWQDVVDQS